MASSCSPPPPTLLPQPPPPEDSDHRPSSPTPSNPSSPGPILALQSTASPPKKVPPVSWTHLETINLIQAYQDKWYSLKKGQLKAGQWEEVAITVAARCGYDEPSKSAIQCRHKIEKLRKRYRGEKLKPFPNSWPYFELMEGMDRGPLPISARPMSMIKSQKLDPNDDDEGSDSDVEINFGYINNSNRSKSKSINHIIRGDVDNMSKATVDRGFDCEYGRFLRVSRNPMTRKRMKYTESDEEEEEEVKEEGGNDEWEGGGGGRSEMVVELAAEIREFADRFVKMENKKIEMMRDMERYWMEMENKRMKMIVDSEKKIVDSIGSAFDSCKKMKTAQGT